MGVQDTSHAAYSGLRGGLPRRERQVWDALAACRRAPTAYELTDAMQRAGVAFDLNSVRPRLTALHEKGHVRRCGKRACGVTGKRVYTWAVIAGHPPAPRERKAAPAPSRAEARLF